MLIRRAADIRPSEITPPDIYRGRRRFIAQAGGIALAGALPVTPASAATAFGALATSPFSTTETPTSRRAVTTYNNFYELGTDKSD
ncbi:MAG: mononuclear molybdenum enzyme YedY, partial [Zoogloea sp.]|nr:mononuclear molybdenum enzyme YedY [Zoogloea sp.]